MTRRWARDRSEERQPEQSCVETATRQPTVWYVIPSASRERASECLPVWRAKGYRTAVIVDAVERYPRSQKEALERSWVEEHGDNVDGADITVPVRRYSGYFRSVNALAKLVIDLDQNCVAVVTGGDDIFPDDDHDPIEIAAQCYAAARSACWVMQPEGDDLPGTREICGSPWFGIEWVRRAYLGHGPMPPFYTQFFGDAELRTVASRHGSLLTRPDLTQRHEHWIRGRPKAQHQIDNDARWGADSHTYRSRDPAFPGSELLIASPPPLCGFDPRTLIGEPIGMFHCPECGEMVVAGLAHPDYSLLDASKDP